MLSRNSLWIYGVLAVLIFCTSTHCQAQWRPVNQPGQKVIRGLGHGWSAGYHWRTPGHDSGYYNPYSHHNSHRITNFGGDWSSSQPWGNISPHFQGHPAYSAPASPMVSPPPYRNDLFSNSVIENKAGNVNGQKPANGNGSNAGDFDAKLRDYQNSSSDRESIEITEPVQPRRKEYPDAEWPLPLRD